MCVLNECSVLFLYETKGTSCIIGDFKPLSDYDFRQAGYDAINDVLYSQPFNHNIVEANSADNVSFTDSVNDI